MPCFSKICPEVKTGIYFVDDFNVNIMQIKPHKTRLHIVKKMGAPTSSTHLKQIFSKSNKTVLGPTCPQICLIAPSGNFLGIFTKFNFYLFIDPDHPAALKKALKEWILRYNIAQFWV